MPQDSLTQPTATARQRKMVAYRSESSRSKALYQRATRVMPGGNSRHSTVLSPYPIYVSHGKGCRVTDVEGEERIDFLNNYTSLILGHADPRVTQAVQRRMALSTAFTMPTESEVELAELITSRVSYIDQVRFCNSGSEAVLLAINAARAFTGKPKIAKFEGAYHGIYDYVQVSESASASEWGEAEAPASVSQPGLSPRVADDVVVLPWNNFPACRRLIAKHGDGLAAVIVDPMPLGIGLIPPQPGFLELLREETERNRTLLISDEVLSFRVSYHGALHEHGVGSDLTTLAKIIGGGFPVGAVTGSAKVMSVFDHTQNWRVHHGGTFNANPVTMTAGLETMKHLTPAAYDELERLGDLMRDRLARMFSDRGIAARICGKASLFTAHLTDHELMDFRSLQGFSRTNPVYGELCHQMLANGIVTTPRGVFGCLSTAMGIGEVEAFVDALDRSLTALGYRP
jgi:glutamate-1-semialdehyde 2,1-aminomutase